MKEMRKDQEEELAGHGHEVIPKQGSFKEVPVRVGLPSKEPITGLPNAASPSQCESAGEKLDHVPQ